MFLSWLLARMFSQLKLLLDECAAHYPDTSPQLASCLGLDVFKTAASCAVLFISNASTNFDLNKQVTPNLFSTPKILLSNDAICSIAPRGPNLRVLLHPCVLIAASLFLITPPND